MSTYSAVAELKIIDSATAILSKITDSLTSANAVLENVQSRFDNMVNVAASAASSISQSIEALSSATASASASVSNLDANLEQLDVPSSISADIVDVTESTGELNNEAQALSDTTAEIGDSVEQTGTTWKSVFDKITSSTASFTVSTVIAGVTAVTKCLLDAADAASSFNSGMAEVFTLMPGRSAEAYQSMSRDMMEFSEDMNILTSDAVPALYSAISAGVDAGDVYSFLEIAQKAAVGGVSNLETSVDGLTSVVNAYGKEVLSYGEASDLMFTTVKLGKTTFDELSSSLYNVIPTASAANIAFGDVSAALAVITAQGTPTSVATTKLRQMFVELTDSGSAVSKTFDEITGTSFKSFIAEGGNVQDALQELESYAGTANLGLDELFSSVEAGSAALMLTGTSTESFASAISEMAVAAGATDTAYATMVDTCDYKTQQLTVALDNLKITVGDVFDGVVGDMASGAATAVNMVTDLIDGSDSLATRLDDAWTQLTDARGYQALNARYLELTTAMENTTISAAEMAEIETELTQVKIALAEASGGVIDATNMEGEAFAASVAHADALAEKAKADLISELIDSRSEYNEALETSAYLSDKAAQAETRYWQGIDLHTQSAEELYSTAVSAGKKLQDTMDALSDDPNRDTVFTTGLHDLEAFAEAATGSDMDFTTLQQYYDWIDSQDFSELARWKGLETASTEWIDSLEKRLHSDAIISDFEANVVEAVQQGLVTASEAAEYFGVSLDTINGGLADVTDTATDTADSIDSVMTNTEALESYVANLGAGMSVSITGILTDLQTLETEYNSAYESALGSIQGQVTLFENMNTSLSEYWEDGGNIDTSSMVEALETQETFYSRYLTLIDKLKDAGLNDGLISTLSTGSVEDISTLQTIFDDITSGGNEVVEALNSKFQSVQDMQAELASSVVNLSGEYDTQFAAIEARIDEFAENLDLVDYAAKLGSETAKSYAESFSAALSSVSSAFSGVRSAVFGGQYSTAAAVVAMPEIEANAGGTTFASNAFIAGEEGPELVVGRKGSTVFPTGETDKIIDTVGGGTKRIELSMSVNGRVPVDQLTTKDDVVNILADNIKEQLMEVLQEEIMVEGERSYNW